jgi:hypothetical protein
MLPDLVPPFFRVPPVWEIRVGDFRVYYDVDDEVVNIRAIRTKPPHQTTEQVRRQDTHRERRQRI